LTIYLLIPFTIQRDAASASIPYTLTGPLASMFSWSFGLKPGWSQQGYYFIWYWITWIVSYKEL
jgi:hypothetical protein